MEFEGKISDLQKKNMGFHLKPKNTLLPVEPGGMRM